MKVQLGSYTFQVNEASLSINKRGLIGDNGLVYAWEHNWNISGRIIRDTVAELGTAIEELEVAVQVIDSDCRVLFDDGSATVHNIPYLRTLNGIRAIIPPSYPTSEGAEYVTYRTFNMTIQAEVGFTPAGGSQATTIGLTHWQESVSISGGHPLDVNLICLNAPPVRQRVSPQVPWVGVQSGRAIGLLGYPARPANIFAGAAVDGDLREFSTPDENNAGVTQQASNYPVSWTYRVSSPDPLTGKRPTRPR